MHGILPEVLVALGVLAAITYFGSFAVGAHLARRHEGENAAWLVMGVYVVATGVAVLVAGRSGRGISLGLIAAAGLLVAAWRIEKVHGAAERSGGERRTAPSGMVTVGAALGLSLAVASALVAVTIAVNPGLLSSG